MIIEYVQINPDKSPAENIRIIKSYLDDLADNINFLTQNVEALSKKLEESEVK